MKNLAIVILLLFSSSAIVSAGEINKSFIRGIAIEGYDAERGRERWATNTKQWIQDDWKNRETLKFE